MAKSKINIRTAPPDPGYGHTPDRDTAARTDTAAGTTVRSLCPSRIYTHASMPTTKTTA